MRPRLQTCIDNGDTLEVDLDGTQGYGTSFLEEAFGGLIREDHFALDDILDHVRFVSEEEPYLIDDIKLYLKAANDEREL